MHSIDILHDHTKLIDIKIIKKCYGLPLDKVQNAKSFHFDISIEDTVNLDTEDQNTFYILKSINIKVLEKVKDNEIEFVDFGMVYTFNFDGFQNLVSISGNSIIIDDQLSEWLDNVVLSSTRGAMYSELRGSYIDGLVFPLIKPKDLKL